MPDPVVFCADIGSVRTGRFGWARGTPGGDAFVLGESMEELAHAVARDLQSGALVALGFECPLFVPIRERPVDLTRARRGDGNRPWSAGAGCAVLAIGVPQVVWVLRQVRREVGDGFPSYVEWGEASTERPGLFLWEAFVTGGAKATGGTGLHARDAELAVHAFLEALPDVDEANAIEADDVQSLVGAALVRTGWTDRVEALAEPCLVIRV